MPTVRQVYLQQHASSASETGNIIQHARCNFLLTRQNVDKHAVQVSESGAKHDAQKQLKTGERTNTMLTQRSAHGQYGTMAILQTCPYDCPSVCNSHSQCETSYYIIKQCSPHSSPHHSFWTSNIILNFSWSYLLSSGVSNVRVLKIGNFLKQMLWLYAKLHHMP